MAATQALTYTGSLHYATGEYIFTERTHTLYLVNGLGLRAGGLNLSASVPLVLQNSEAIGDLPELELKNSFSYSLGLGMPLGSGRWTVLGTFSAPGRIVPTPDPAASVGLGSALRRGPAGG
jgi:hypothetical protein